MELTGIHRKSLSGYENNVAEPDLSTFATLANLYGISADEVLDIGGKSSSDSLPQCEFQVLSLFKELDPHLSDFCIQKIWRRKSHNSYFVRDHRRKN